MFHIIHIVCSYCMLRERCAYIGYVNCTDRFLCECECGGDMVVIFLFVILFLRIRRVLSTSESEMRVFLHVRVDLALAPFAMLVCMIPCELKFVCANKFS